MNDLKIFENLEFGNIRINMINEEPMFCLVDVCNALDIKNVSECKSRLNQKGVSITDTLSNGGLQKTTFISEANLYKCIFQSRKKNAEMFQEWICLDC